MFTDGRQFDLSGVNAGVFRQPEGRAVTPQKSWIAFFTVVRFVVSRLPLAALLQLLFLAPSVFLASLSSHLSSFYLVPRRFCRRMPRAMSHGILRVRLIFTAARGSSILAILDSHSVTLFYERKCTSASFFTMRGIHLAFFSLLICLLSLAAAQKTALDNPVTIELYRNFRRWTGQAIGRTGREKQFLRKAKDQNRMQNYYEGSFPCNISMGRSPEVPKSVHQLRPGDIDIIGAMGDSLTAGLGIFATNLMHILIENRGVVYSGGGQGTWREYLTLPNIIKEFNPDLYGYAVSDSFTFEEESQFNVAESGAMSKDMPYMARALINRMKSDPRVNLRKHWKLITLMIGANDFCSDMCYLPEASITLDNHKSDLLQVLRSFRDELPRTFVSILPPPHLKVLVEINARSLLCDLMIDFECPCLFGLAYRSQRKKFYDIMTRWHHLEEEIALYPEFQRDDFTVVVQPLTTNLTFPMTSDELSDMSYLSTDCFHISQKTNARTANALWNNMMEPVGKKSRNWSDVFEKFVCPNQERPYFATQMNSKAF